jgi:hypothetical protein
MIMSSVRAPVSAVTTQLATLLRDDVEAVANGNTLISQAEQASAPGHVRAAAETIRSQGGPGARVAVDAVERLLNSQAQALIGAVNQPTGSGTPFLSLAEAEAAAAQHPALGARVMKARDIVLSRGADTDSVARGVVRAAMAGSTGIFKTFASESDAANFRGPPNRSVYWLVATSETATSKSCTHGRNDLWAERFDVSKTTGAVTVTAQH